jgi:hypothetical protein
VDRTWGLDRTWGQSTSWNGMEPTGTDHFIKLLRDLSLRQKASLVAEEMSDRDFVGIQDFGPCETSHAVGCKDRMVHTLPHLLFCNATTINPSGPQLLALRSVPRYAVPREAVTRDAPLSWMYPCGGTLWEGRRGWHSIQNIDTPLAADLALG